MLGGAQCHCRQYIKHSFVTYHESVFTLSIKQKLLRFVSQNLAPLFLFV